MKTIKSITAVIAVFLIGLTAVSCSKDDEPTMSVSYHASCNESVNITISDGEICFDLKYNVAGVYLLNQLPQKKFPNHRKQIKHKQ